MYNEIVKKELSLTFLLRLPGTSFEIYVMATADTAIL